MPMAGRTRCCVEEFSLGQLSNLEQLEGPWLELIGTGDPECVATALRLFHFHLRMTITRMAPAMVISEAQQNLRNAAEGPEAWSSSEGLAAF